MSISEAIYNEGLAIGYSRIGVSSIDSLVHIPEVDVLKTKYPWAKSMIITVWHYNFFKIPNHLKGRVSKETLFQGRYLQGSYENFAAIDLEEFFRLKAIKAVDIMDLDKSIKKSIAEKMKIGLIRKNGYFYTEEGSYCTLHAWLIDERVEWDRDEAPDPCLAHCGICVKRCPENAIDKNNGKAFEKCMNSKDKVISVSRNQGKTGCDICQDLCPFNKHRWTYEEEFIALDYHKA
jgi:epoxyqueuosine reductase